MGVLVGVSVGAGVSVWVGVDVAVKVGTGVAVSVGIKRVAVKAGWGEGEAGTSAVLLEPQAEVIRVKIMNRIKWIDFIS